MATSMTGFGRGEAKGKMGTVVVETKSLNHRYLEVVYRLPSSLLVLEDKMRDLIQKRCKRGRITVSVSFEKDGELVGLKVDEKRAKQYYQMASQLKKELGLSSDIGLGELLSLPEVVRVETTKEELQELWAQTREALEKAVAQLLQTREEEGKALAIDLLKRVGLLERELGKISKRLPLVIKQYRQRLQGRLEELMNGGALDPGRLEQEIVFFVEGSDITEEVTRIRAHLEALQKAMALKEEVGRRLDFIAQELQREVNTIGQKSRDIEISQSVIQMKGEIERIREQVQNIE